MTARVLNITKPVLGEAPAGDFEKPKAVLACSNGAQNLKFEREDWTSFRTIEGLQQKAGVPKDKLARLVLKELTDNGLDTGAEVEVGPLPKGGFYVEDKGPGIDGTPEQIARLFSIARPMISTKLLRLPTRGALGNGLRVVAGAVLASEGTLTVITRNQRLQLRPERDGSTTVVSAQPVDFPVGTRIEIVFGLALDDDDDDDILHWAKFATMFAAGGDQRMPARHRRGGTTHRNSMSCYLLSVTGRCVSWSLSLMAAVAPRPVRSLPKPSCPVPFVET